MTDHTGPVRLGIVGARGQGAFYATLVADGHVPNMTVGAFSGRSAASRAAVQDRFGDVPFFTDPIEMMDSGTVDAIVTTVPHYLHPDLAVAGIERGVHVLLEKPVGVYPQQVRRMLQVAQTHPDVRLGVLYNQRANPLFIRLKQVLSSGELGQVRRVNWTITNWFRPQSYFDSSPWRGTWAGEGGGVLINQAAHQIDLWQWLCGAPESVFAKIRYGFGHDITVEDDVTAVLDYGQRGSGTFVTATHDMLGVDRLEIQCDQGKVVVQDSRHATITRLDRPMAEFSESMDAATLQQIVQGTVDWSGLSTTEVVEGTSDFGVDHAAVLTNFARAILFGEPVLVTASGGLDALRLSSAMLLSSWLGREVPFDFDEDLFLTELNARISAEGGHPPRN
ncbi:Gfo/Idh/MocA family oxidoreductase [Tessaracoccus sp. SD287]|uniref:Gfo/Idh/MocA family protein n=1 Tax=Tessaracoccus sp. SD287 TaxID=2782008 RepID=UPI001A95CCB9|nr:Gfo/Idh/MocA family oxidoreductase [Tessaracoccus sp. SD287]MBO1031250.1 Gfo/Idh/MocA family oxidoreductase [Tessaracoccus sp. SD287]